MSWLASLANNGTVLGIIALVCAIPVTVLIPLLLRRKVDK